MTRTFFSLPPEYAEHIRAEIVDIVYHSNGGFSWNDLYWHVSVPDRKMIIRKLNDIKKKEKRQIEKAKGGGGGNQQQTYGPPKSNMPTPKQQSGQKPKSPNIKPDGSASNAAPPSSSTPDIPDAVKNKFKKLMGEQERKASQQYERRFKNED